MTIKRFEAGETIFEEGSDADFAYMILSGQVDIVKRTERGLMRLAQLGKGEIFGEMGLVEEKPRSAAAIARHPVTLRVVDRTGFLDLLRQDLDAALPIVRALFERLRAMNARYAEIFETESGHIPYTGDVAIRLVPLTPEVTEILTLDGVRLERFPFRIGRDPAETESSPLDYNDIAFPDQEPFRLSLNHFMIEHDQRGVIVRANSVRLYRRVNEIVAGPDDSPFRFQLLIDEPGAARPEWP